MEGPHATERIEGEGITRDDGAQRDGADPQCLEDARHRRRVRPQERRWHQHPAHAEALEQLGQGVEVVGIGMGDHDRVDP